LAGREKSRIAREHIDAALGAIFVVSYKLPSVATASFDQETVVQIVRPRFEVV
jgi:hypothetical protein